MMNEEIRKGAVEYATYISNNIPQTENEQAKYYFSGSLAMLLLSSATTLKPISFDNNGNITKVEPTINVSEKAREAFSMGLRPISLDVDIVCIDDRCFDRKGDIYNLGAVRKNCKYATSLCSVWGKKNEYGYTYNGTMYFDWLGDDREISSHNLVILETDDGKKILITSPAELMIHKFSEMLSINQEKQKEKYEKDISDFACIFNGLGEIEALPKDIIELLGYMTTVNKNSAVSKLSYLDLSEKIDRVYKDILPKISTNLQQDFKLFIDGTSKFNKEQIAIEKQ